MNKQFVEEFLESEKKWSWFWDTLEGKQRFVENMVNISHYNWGGDSSALIQPTRDGDFEFLQGTEAFMRLKAYRDRKVDKKRILVMEDCSIEHLIALMANIDFQEACHIGEFLSRMRLMDSHEMRFTEHTILPDNLWITEFNVNFITVPALNDVDLSRSSSYFSKKRAKFQSINDFESEYMMAEAAIGFRFIGDLHDRYWTCYVFYDFGSMELSSEARTQVADSDYGKTASQRKCLEGFLVRQALELVISETKRVLQVIAVSMGGSNEKSQTLFNPLLTEDDLSGENYFKTMNKNSVFYPWLLEVYGALRDKCIESRIVAEHWLSAEKTRKYKPRWSEKDQKTFGEKVMTSRLEVNSLCTKVEKMAKNLQERIDRIKTLKESLSSELGLREARTSTQLAQTVNLFAVVTTIYLPLTFSTSIVAIQDFHWPSPAKSLVKITLAVTFGTLILLMNLAFLRRNLAAVQFWAHRSIRRKMAGAPEPHRPKKSVYPEKRPAWKYWKECAQGLQEAEKRITLLTDNTIHDSKSDWWYWYFLAVFIIIVVPVQELTFIIHTLRRQQVEGAGPLKKLVRIPWAPIWVVQLAIVYVVILVGYAILFVVGLVHRAAVWLWTGSDIKKSHKGADPQADEKSLKFQTDTLLEVTKQVPWWKRPAKTMQFAIVAEALRAERIVDDHDLEKQGAS
ncbi:hypothetical protein L873DRAFT_1706507 [Choiromyces venosus 120613-1]|uniref:Cora-domain-containing protein n=1 Tax=Choiromyces venosus 120613-1 TaxID=1336337 RepID=A0A3N4J995_9PEZI|nr:hypothetical protein L873DRAFT_1706507 [Choiromyces venosus 120613-1]